MNTPVDIEPRKSSLLGASSNRAARSLPPDLVAKARRRLGALALFFAVLGGIAIPLHLGLLISGHESPTQMLFDLGSGVISALVYLLARNPRMPATRVFALGIVFELVICFNAALTGELYMQAAFGHSSFLPPAGMLIVLFPLVLPSRPRDAALISLAAAATQPLGQGLLEAMGLFDITLSGYLYPFGGAVMAAIMAAFGARVIYGVTVEVTKARELGSYRLEEPMARGGMGEVWRARHHMLARPAAIKLVRGDIAHSEDRDRILRRFEREAQVTATLESPHTVKLYDFGVTQDSAYYYVMELLDGIDLEELVIRHGPLPPARAIHIIHQLCHSLDEAHGKGLVHRDIKPSNILLCRYGPDFDFVKVLDFGLVSLRPEAASEDVRLTAEALVGTPAFIAPEIASGDGAEVDHRVDLYAIGCVAYWLLTGNLVFERKSAMALIVAHATETPERPSALLGQAVPGALEDLVMACLAKKPDERPQSAAELRSRLASVTVNGVDSLDGTDARWDGEQARQWWETHRPTDRPEGRESIDGDSRGAAGDENRGQKSEVGFLDTMIDGTQ